jgi:hypothetical protein
MYFNEGDLKLYYEMKKEEMEQSIAANRYAKENKKTPFYKSFMNVLQSKQSRKKAVVPQLQCCSINSQGVCCEG